MGVIKIVVFSIVFLSFIDGYMCQPLSLDSLLGSSVGISPAAIGTVLNYLYQMVKTFLNLVTPDSSCPILLDIMTNNTGCKGKLSASSLNSITDNLQSTVLKFGGFIACIVIGILFMMIGCCGFCTFCCCRACGLCGAGIRKKPISGSDRLKKTIVGLFLISVVALSIAGVACSYSSDQAFSSIFKTSSNPYPPVIVTILDPFKGLFNFIYGLPDDMLRALDLNSTTNSLKIFVNSLAARLQTNLRNICPECNDTLAAVDILSTDLNNISDSLSTIQSSTNNLQSLQSVLVLNITGFRSSVLNAISDAACTTNDCTVLKSNLTALAVGPKNYSLVPNLTNAIQSAQQFQLTNIGSLLTKALSPDILSSFTNQTSGITTQIESAVSSISALLNDTIPSILEDYLAPNSSFMSQTIKILNDYVAYYAAFALPIISSLFLPIIVLTIVGLVLGLVKIGPYEKVFVGSACYSFLIGAIVMILVMFLFLFGGFVYTQLCRDILKEENSAYLHQLKSIAKSFNIGIGNITFFNITFDLNKLDFQNVIFSQCKQSKSLFEIVLNIIPENQTVDSLSGYLNLGMISQKIGQSIDLRNITVIDDSTAQALNSYAQNIFLISTDFFSFQLNSSLTTVPLDTLLVQIQTLANTTTNVTSSAVLRNQAGNLQTIMSTTGARISANEDVLRRAIYHFDTVTGKNGPSTFPNHTADVVTGLLRMQATLRNNGTQLVQNLLLTVFRDVDDFFRNLIISLIGRLKTVAYCRPIYDVIHGVFSVICETFLNPFNALWFTFGWCAAMLIPSIVLGLWIGGLFSRKSSQSETSSPIKTSNNIKTKKAASQQLSNGSRKTTLDATARPSGVPSQPTVELPGRSDSVSKAELPLTPRAESRNPNVPTRDYAMTPNSWDWRPAARPPVNGQNGFYNYSNLPRRPLPPPPDRGSQLPFPSGNGMYRRANYAGQQYPPSGLPYSPRLPYSPGQPPHYM